MKNEFLNKLKKVLQTALIALLIVSITLSNNMAVKAANAPDKNLHVYYFNVGLGTCAILEKEKHYMLVDTGMKREKDGKEYVLSNIKDWMKKHNVTKFDYVIISHYDSDHVGNLRAILNLDDENNKIKVGQFLARKYSKKVLQKMDTASNSQGVWTYYRNYQLFSNIVAEYASNTNIKENKKILEHTISNIPKKTTEKFENVEDVYKHTNYVANKAKGSKGLLWKNPIKDFSCTFGPKKGIKIKFYSLHNDTSYFGTEGAKKPDLYSEDINNDSLVFSVTYKKNKFWFFNDLKKKGMEALLVKLGKKNMDVFKGSVVLIPHHGIYHDNITKSLNKNYKFTEKLSKAQFLIRSLSNHTLKCNQLELIKKLPCKKIYSTSEHKWIEIIATGKKITAKK